MIDMPAGERVLICQFEKMLRELFEHGGARVDCTIEELLLEHAWDYVAASALLADNEFGGEIAAEFCRRAQHLRQMSAELSAFLACSAEERAELPTIQRAAELEEIRKQQPELRPAVSVNLNPRPASSPPPAPVAS